MPRVSTIGPRAKRPTTKRLPTELLVPKRMPRGRKANIIQLQWYDGAGEMQYEELSPAQSWPYLSRN